MLLVWGLHHFDYPVLRARGAWNPWGYYLDILFVLAMGIGIVVLVLEELDRRTRELARLSARMVRQHEDERQRVSLELHDQTAQVWAAVKLQLGLVRERAPATLELIAKNCKLGRFLRFRRGKFGSDTEADDASDVLGAGTPPLLLASALDQRLDLNAFADHEGADALGTADLVR